ncbi:MAG TPA: VWA domain-containing protein [Pyrinomonadaceae bacterium]|nr:VWA domain-containing protein [Pyrinomonadaceae bacterium]
MNSLGILRATLLIVSLASCRSLIAQQLNAAAPTPVTSVNLSLIVTDREKHSRDDVTKEDVQVFEAGVAQTTFTITKEEKPVNYVIAIDTSGSFRSLLPGILVGARLLIEGNKASDETMLIRFISHDKIETVEKFTADKSKLVEDLKSFKIEMGQSAVVDAIYVAVQAAAENKSGDPSIRRALVLFSDGEDRASFYTTDQLIKLLRARNVQVFVVGVIAQLDGERGLTRPSPKEKAEKLLKRVALESGGRVFFPTNMDELAGAVDEINHDLHTQYLISYESKNNPGKDNFRKIEVKMVESPGRAKLTAITRPGYFIQPPDLDEKEKKKKSK